MSFEGKPDSIPGDEIVPNDGGDAVSGDDTTDDASHLSGDAVPSNSLLGNASICGNNSVLDNGSFPSDVVSGDDSISDYELDSLGFLPLSSTVSTFIISVTVLSGARTFPLKSSHFQT